VAVRQESDEGFVLEGREHAETSSNC
jgi:hypothetical protein